MLKIRTEFNLLGKPPYIPLTQILRSVAHSHSQPCLGLHKIKDEHLMVVLNTANSKAKIESFSPYRKVKPD